MMWKKRTDYMLRTHLDFLLFTFQPFFQTKVKNNLLNRKVRILRSFVDANKIG